MTTTVLNAGLELALEFGENWLQPIQTRLAQQHPELSSAELEECDAICREAMTFGHEQVRVCWRGAGTSQDEAFRRFRDAVRRRFDWIDDARLSHLFSQGCYYAWKDGDLP